MPAKDERDELCSALRFLSDNSSNWAYQKIDPDSPVYEDTEWPAHFRRQIASMKRIRSMIEADIDRWISQLLGTQRGRWTTELLAIIRKMQMVLVYADPKDNRKRKRQLNAIIKRAGEIQDRCVQLMDIDLAGWKESVDVLPHGFRRENIVRAIMQALEKSTDRLPFAKVVEKSGYRKDAVRSSLRYLISVGKVIHHGKRGGYSPNRTRP